MPKLTGEVADDPRIATISADVKLALTRINALHTTANAIQTTTHAMTIANAEAGKVSALAAAVAMVDAKVDLLAAAVAKIGTVHPPPPPPPPPPPVSDWPLAEQPAAGTTATLTAGTKPGAMHIENAGVTIRGAGMRKTILDGQNGAGAGHRLAWGKGIIHTTADATIEDVSFIRGGGGDNNSDGEAGAYCEGGTLTLRRCSFDGCENAAYMQPREYMPAGTVAKMVIDKCVFGRVGPNGLNDERSHDVYLGGQDVLIENSVFVGNARGNTVKVRGERLTLRNNWIGRFNGRFVDIPTQTIAASEGNTYVTREGAASNNAFGLFDEGDMKNADGPGCFISTDDTFIFGGRWKEEIWTYRPDLFKVEFIRPKVFWVGARGSTPPQIVFTTNYGGPPDLRVPGMEFFVLTEANRIDAFPAVPADPV